jgi:hypothetical protein
MSSNDKVIDFRKPAAKRKRADVNGSPSDPNDTRPHVVFQPDEFEPQVRFVIEHLAKLGNVFVSGPRLVQINQISKRQQELSAWTDSSGRTRHGMVEGSPHIVTLARSSSTSSSSLAVAMFRAHLQTKWWMRFMVGAHGTSRPSAGSWSRPS